MSATRASEPTPSGPGELLAAAEGLARAERWREALDVATRAYETDPDPALAQQIVLLRHKVVGLEPVASTVPVWPPALADPFPGLAGLPEIRPEELTAAVLGGAILHHGCVLVRGLQDPADAVALREEIDRSIDARDRALAGAPLAGDGTWHRPFERRGGGVEAERKWVHEAGGMLMADVPTVMLDFLGVLDAAGALDAIGGYFGEPPVLSFNKCVLRKLRRSEPTWHQDGSFMGAEVRTVDVWLALTDCGGGTDAPGLDVVPQRLDRLLETRTQGAIFPHTIGQGVIDGLASDRARVSPTFAPGDALLFDERLVHRSGVGEGFVTERHAVEAWFFAASSFPPQYVPILA